MAALTTQSVMAEDDIRSHADDLLKIIHSGNYKELLSKMKPFSLHQRKTIVNYVSGLNAPLPVACKLKHDNMVRFLMAECGAEINHKNNGTLLWNAVDAQDRALVEALIENGADINSVSDSGVPVLHLALQHGVNQYYEAGSSTQPSKSSNFYELVYFLIEKGADVNIRDMDQRTCLDYLTSNTPANRDMLQFVIEHGFDVRARCSDEMTYLMVSVLRQNVWLCQYLISKGIELNATDIKGRTALHYTCMREILSKNQNIFMKILTEAGIDVNVVDKENLSAIQLAASNHCPVIVEYLASIDSVPISTKASAYDILGALISTRSNAYDSWLKALQFRQNSASMDEEFENHLPAVIPGTDNLESQEDLERVTENDESVLLHSLFVLDRYLGRHSLYTLYKLKELAIYYWKRQESGGGISTVKYAFVQILNGNKCLLTDWSCTNTLRDIFSTWYKYFNEVNEIIYDDVIEIFSGFYYQVELLTLACNGGVTRPASNASDVFIDCLSILFYLQQNDMNEGKYKKQCKRLVDLDQRYTQAIGHGLLHKVLTRRYNIDRKQPDQRILIADSLIKGGLSVNATDTDKNTPLHLLIRTSNVDENKEIVTFLLEQGTHVDMRNKFGETVLRLLEKTDLALCKVKNTSLQCLAATAIMREKLVFRGTLPKFLESFIEAH